MKKKNKKTLRIILLYYLPLILWMGMIYYFSSLPGLGLRYPPDISFYITRKGAHVAEYFVLTLLLIRIVRLYRLKKRELYQLIVLLPLTYAFSDELHQLFVVGREGKLLDVGVDFLGIIMAITLGILFNQKWLKIRKKIYIKIGSCIE